MILSQVQMMIHQMTSQHFAQKYAPTSTADMVGLKRPKADLRCWLENYEENRSIALSNMKKKKRNTKKDTKTTAKTATITSCAVMIGDHGSGKSCLIETTLKEMGYEPKFVTPSSMTMSMDCRPCSMEKEAKITKRALVVGEVDSITSGSEKNIVADILSNNNKNWVMPVIFVINNKHSKIANSLKKDCFNIRLFALSDFELKSIVTRVCLGENMRLVCDSVKDIIVQHSGGDIRKLLSVMQFIKETYGEDKISHDMLRTCLRYTDMRSAEKSIYESTIDLFTDFQSIGKVTQVFESDKVNIPLMVHQNHYSATSKYSASKKASLLNARDISRCLANADIIENFMYSNQVWNLQETQGSHSCVIPSYKISKSINTQKLLLDSRSLSGGKFRTVFPMDLNRTSTRKINCKNIRSASEFFNNMNVPDFIRAGRIIQTLSLKPSHEQCENVISDYNDARDAIMYILKINKINGTKNAISKETDKCIKKLTSKECSHVSKKPVSKSLGKASLS